MINDYTKEIGLPSNKKTVSRPVAVVLLAIVAVGISFGVVSFIRQSKEHADEKAATPAAMP